MTTKKKSPANRAKQPKVKPTGFPTDAESVALRQESAVKEKAGVKRIDNGEDAFHGDFEVASTQWDHPYVVEIRSLDQPLNTCSCQDHRMNGLGTCKHIERVLQYLVHRRKRRFEAAAKTGPTTYEVFFDERGQSPVLGLLRPSLAVAAIEMRIALYFDSEGIVLGTPSEVWPSLEREIADLPAKLRCRIRLSKHGRYWLERECHQLKLQRLQQRFESDVAAGKRSDNPVNLPLYPYQRQGMQHLAFHGRALLADEMGLGKTVQAIAASELLRRLGEAKRVLVISPASLKTEWEDQIAQFTGIQATAVYGSRAARRHAYSEGHAYTLCNYEQIRVDVDDINRLLLPDIVILDEAQRIKNWPTKTAKTIKRVSSPYAFVLTGTPLENRIEELYSLVEFVDPHVFGSLFRFQRAYMDISPENDIRPKNLDQLHRQVSSVMLRRRKGDVEDSLPERTDKNFFVTMTPEQRARYGEFEYEVAKLIAIMKRRPLLKREHDRLQQLLACMRMTCDTPYILDQECRDCPKLEELDAILDDLLEDPDTKIIIFSEWVRMLGLVKELLDAKHVEYAEHTGKIPQKDRRAQIKRFKEDAVCRFFLSSESGGTGLNLQVANVVINLDLPWNPAKLEQRIARAWRKHQKRAVRVINLVSKDTIEEAMLGKLAYKTALADSVLDGAAFKESPRGESGRQAFAARVGALLGSEPSPPQVVKEAADGSRTSRSLEAVLAAQFADSVIGIERQKQTGASVVVARPGSNSEALADAVRASSDGNAIVITPEMKLLLVQLQAMGVLTLSSDLAAVHAAEGYTALTDAGTSALTPALNYESARETWSAAERELKATQALGGLGLYEQAMPHATAVASRAQTAIASLYDCTDNTMPPDASPMHKALMAQLREDVTSTAAPAERVPHILTLADDLERLLHAE